MDTLAEVRSLRAELVALDDHTTAALLAKAEQHLTAWPFDAGWRWLEKALEER